MCSAQLADRVDQLGISPGSHRRRRSARKRPYRGGRHKQSWTIPVIVSGRSQRRILHPLCTSTQHCPTSHRYCLLVGCLTSQQQASVSQGRICSDNFTCCHTETEVADQMFYFTQSQYTDTGLTSPSADPITPGAWQGSHWSANFEPGTFRSRGGRFTTRPTRQSLTDKCDTAYVIYSTYLFPSLPVEHRPSTTPPPPLPQSPTLIALCSGLLLSFQTSWSISYSNLIIIDTGPFVQELFKNFKIMFLNCSVSQKRGTWHLWLYNASKCWPSFSCVKHGFYQKAIRLTVQPWRRLVFVWSLFPTVWCRWWACCFTSNQSYKKIAVSNRDFVFTAFAICEVRLSSDGHTAKFLSVYCPHLVDRTREQMQCF